MKGDDEEEEDEDEEDDGDLSKYDLSDWGDATDDKQKDKDRDDRSKFRSEERNSRSRSRSPVAGRRWGNIVWDWDFHTNSLKSPPNSVNVVSIDAVLYICLL